MMKIERNKIVFAGIILCVVLFIGTYSMVMLEDDQEPTIENNQIPIPELENGQKEYKSKLEALDDLKEVRQSNAPSIYDERLLDSAGVYDRELLEKEKRHIIDSIYEHGHVNYINRSYRSPKVNVQPEVVKKNIISNIPQNEIEIISKELGLEHQLFFASNPLENESKTFKDTDSLIYVRVDGTQTVRKDYRLQMRFSKDAIIDGMPISKNTAVYGFVSFRPNRTIITINSINHRPVKLKAFDLQDGSEGIYIENTFKAEARQEVVGDVVDDINITGVPQVSGIKKIFQRNNRITKVTIYDNYQLILASANH